MNYSDEEFVSLLIEAQPRLYGFILSMLGNRNDADDLLQRTNVVLLRKQLGFRKGTSFWAWAKQVAFLEVCGFRKEMARNRTCLSNELIEQLVDADDGLSGDQDKLKGALRRCLARLTDQRRRLVESRYSGKSVNQIAADAKRTVPAITQELYRIRAGLAKCIKLRLSRD